jgi:hypothetical protein
MNILDKGVLSKGVLKNKNNILSKEVLEKQIFESNRILFKVIEEEDDKKRFNESLGTKELKDVKSYSIDLANVAAKGLWNSIVKKLKNRDKLIDTLLKYENNTTLENDKLLFLKDELWDTLKTNVYNANFNYKTYITNGYYTNDRNYLAPIEQENEALTHLTNQRFKNLISSIQGKEEFHEYIKSFARKIVEITEELEEKNRYDDYFEGQQVLDALDKMKDIQFYPSEIKALVFQESSDLTNTLIDGIKDKTKGVKIKVKNTMGAIGIAQITDIAMRDAMQWVRENKIILKGSDPRKSPESAIILCACILSSNYNRYIKIAVDKIDKTPYSAIVSSDIKKLVIASYNSSGPNISYIIDKLKTTKYDVIASDIKFPDETRKYVPLILNRL